MEIEVGEYVRTKTGFIGKLNKISNYIINNKNKTMYLVDFGERVFCISINDIVKHSKNIIDLIEVGDYINRYRVEQVSIETNEVLLDHNGFGWRTLKDGDKIVTKEQFSSIEYKLEEDK